MIANSGDEVELKVLMAAFDSDKQPVVNVPTLLHINPIFFLVLLVMEVGIVLIDI
jgi:hypothetical protein